MLFGQFVVTEYVGGGGGGGGLFEFYLFSSLSFSFKQLEKLLAHFTFTFKLVAIRHQLLEFNFKQQQIQRRTYNFY